MNNDLLIKWYSLLVDSSDNKSDIYITVEEQKELKHIIEELLAEKNAQMIKKYKQEIYTFIAVQKTLKPKSDDPKDIAKRDKEAMKLVKNMEKYFSPEEFEKKKQEYWAVNFKCEPMTEEEFWTQIDKIDKERKAKGFKL